MILTELQKRILGLCKDCPRDLRMIIRLSTGYQPQTIRNNINDLCIFEYLEKRRCRRGVVYMATEKGRLAFEGREIVDNIKLNPMPEQIMLTNFIVRK